MTVADRPEESGAKTLARRARDRRAHEQAKQDGAERFARELLGSLHPGIEAKYVAEAFVLVQTGDAGEDVLYQTAAGLAFVDLAYGDGAAAARTAMNLDFGAEPDQPRSAP